MHVEACAYTEGLVLSKEPSKQAKEPRLKRFFLLVKPRGKTLVLKKHPAWGLRDSGLLSLPLLRLGCRVLALDRSLPALQAVLRHAQLAAPGQAQEPVRQTVRINQEQSFVKEIKNSKNL